MPKLNLGESFPKPQQESESYSDLSYQHWENIIKNNKGRHLGKGASSYALLDEKNEDKILAISFNGISPTEAKEIYYAQKVLHTLFPYNFPEINAVFASREDNSTTAVGSMREKVSGKTLKDLDASIHSSSGSEYSEPSFLVKVKNYFDDYKMPEIKHPFKVVMDERAKLRKLGLTIPLDVKPDNFILDEDGKEMYVDVSKMMDKNVFGVDMNYNAVSEYMKEKGYQESDIRTVISSLKRLGAIKEAYFKSSPSQN